MSTWVPESERDTRWFLFKQLFKVRISNIQSMSMDYLKLHGMLDTGDPYQNQQQAHELIDRMLPISEMVKFFSKGVTIRVVRYSDTKEIYEIISNHLMFWKNQLETGFHVKNAPIEDLVLLDKFAVSVYDHAKHQFTTEMVDSILARTMSSTMRATRNTILKQPAVVINKIENKDKDENKYPERLSLADAFIQHQNRINAHKRW